MLLDLLKTLDREKREQLRDFGITDQLVSNWRTGRRLPTEVQAVALASVCGVDRHELQDEIALMRATPEQRTLLERVMSKSAGVIATVAVMVAVVFGSLTANGPTAFSRSR
jgi:hypothetical protein